MQQKFKAKLTAIGPGGAWTILPIPFNVAEVFGTKARVPVAGTMNGFAFRNSLMPEGDGTHRMMVGKELQAGAKARAGDIVSVVMKHDDETRSVEVPAELAAALKKNKQAASFFVALSPSCKAEYANWISNAKQAETKAGRAAKAIGMLVAGKKRLR
ncbi:MAG TPA: YdeI/OmpD-associated family protein [Terracidiphilus sp.]|nr:YdeI/OmpD-associated family protein [Terracidiphilus sp.]